MLRVQDKVICHLLEIRAWEDEAYSAWLSTSSLYEDDDDDSDILSFKVKEYKQQGTMQEEGRRKVRNRKKKVRKKREREEAKKRTTRSCLGVTWLDLESSTTLFPGTAIERVRTGPPCSLMTGVLPCSGPTGGLLRKTLIHRPM